MTAGATFRPGQLLVARWQTTVSMDRFGTSSTAMLQQLSRARHSSIALLEGFSVRLKADRVNDILPAKGEKFGARTFWSATHPLLIWAGPYQLE